MRRGRTSSGVAPCCFAICCVKSKFVGLSPLIGRMANRNKRCQGAAGIRGRGTRLQSIHEATNEEQPPQERGSKGRGHSALAGGRTWCVVASALGCEHGGSLRTFHGHQAHENGWWPRHHIFRADILLTDNSRPYVTIIMAVATRTIVGSHVSTCRSFLNGAAPKPEY